VVVWAKAGAYYTIRGGAVHKMGRQLAIGYGTAWNDVQRVKQGL